MTKQSCLYGLGLPRLPADRQTLLHAGTLPSVARNENLMGTKALCQLVVASLNAARFNVPNREPSRLRSLLDRMRVPL
jgi:hypothetical protein